MMNDFAGVILTPIYKCGLKKLSLVLNLNSLNALKTFPSATYRLSGVLDLCIFATWIRLTQVFFLDAVSFANACILYL